jgi:hypothetical protein
MTNVYLLQYRDGRQVRIRAAKFSHDDDNFSFYRTAGAYANAYHAMFSSEDIVNVVAEDMLLSSFMDSTLLPEVRSSGGDGSDFVRDALFTEADKVPFSPAERENVTKALQDAEQKIRETFQPSVDGIDEIHQKLNYLSKKVAQLDKFNWKRLAITTVVGIAVDLGFGTLIPSALLNIFKEIFKQVTERLLKSGGMPDKKPS